MTRSQIAFALGNEAEGEGELVHDGSLTVALLRRSDVVAGVSKL
jgi:hypothetical protein